MSTLNLPPLVSPLMPALSYSNDPFDHRPPNSIGNQSPALVCPRCFWWPPSLLMRAGGTRGSPGHMPRRGGLGCGCIGMIFQQKNVSQSPLDCQSLGEKAVISQSPTVSRWENEKTVKSQSPTWLDCQSSYPSRHGTHRAGSRGTWGRSRRRRSRGGTGSRSPEGRATRGGGEPVSRSGGGVTVYYCRPPSIIHHHHHHHHHPSNCRARACLRTVQARPES